MISQQKYVTPNNKFSAIYLVTKSRKLCGIFTDSFSKSPCIAKKLEFWSKFGATYFTPLSRF
jgi:hypothetical protein